MDIIIYSGMLLIVILLLILIMQNAAIKKQTARTEADKALMKQGLEQNAAAIKSMEDAVSAEVRASRQETLMLVNRQLTDMAMQNEQKLENIRKTMESRLALLTEDNNKQLEKMRQTVDEKLQSTLEERLTRSFGLVSERLEQVYKGLGEMQSLANGVGDLKKVLSNVKTRGILGEIQLSAILEQILTPEQYEENIATKHGSADRVEFAVKLPGDGETCVYLPIDAKFPGETYARLSAAYESGEKESVAQALKDLERTLKSEAKTIRDKYIDPPYTTDFAVMFLPTEGLYAEAVRLGMIETLQREYKVNLAGPSTVAAFLSSLQMGFRTLAIQKRSSQVWEVLGAVKTEFDKFGDVLLSAQQRINKANEDLDRLIGVRTRGIQRKLRDVESLADSESRAILEPYTERPARED